MVMLSGIVHIQGMHSRERQVQITIKVVTPCVTPNSFFYSNPGDPELSKRISIEVHNIKNINPLEAGGAGLTR